MSYIVVLKEKKWGIITWTSFRTKEEFKKERKEFLEYNTIVKENCSIEDAVALVESTPMKCYLNGIMEEAFEEGFFYLPILELKIQTMMGLNPRLNNFALLSDAIICLIDEQKVSKLGEELVHEFVDIADKSVSPGTISSKDDRDRSVLINFLLALSDL